MRWLRQRSWVELGLNSLFVVWVAYFLATGYIVPAPLLPDRGPPAIVEAMEDEPAMPVPEVLDHALES